MKILALSAHPDDVEISCGASLVRFIEEGHEVSHIIFTASEKSNDLSVDDIWKEAYIAQQALGVSNFQTFNFPHRELTHYRSKLLNAMLVLRQTIEPDLVFMPCIEDLHQDHSAVTREALRVFKGVSILGYEMLWNNLEFKAQSFIKITPEQLNKKILAIDAYKSQSFKRYMHPSIVRSLAVSRGVQVGVEFAEAFEVIRWVQ